MKYDIAIIGAGIVGAATAWQLLQQFPQKRVLLLEKEHAPAQHQTGRNSGVIHAGVYYPPDSLKAKYCKAGLEKTIQFCQQHKIAYQQCGKILVACNDIELERMDSLFKRCQRNGLAPERLTQQQLSTIEPNITGRGAFRVKQTGIADYSKITQTLLALSQQANADIFYNKTVNTLSESSDGVRIGCGETHFEAKHLICCGGLMADRLITMMGIDPGFQIIPFRGEYFQLSEQHNQIINHLIYPIPDPELPFLGVHLTRMIDGSVTVGPNAVLAWQREGYGKLDFKFKDLTQMLRFKGFWPLTRQFAKSGAVELKNSLFKSQYIKLVQKYCPKITANDLRPYRSGVRAQAVSSNGELLHDFKFIETPRSLHVGNAPSPAATSAIPIAEAIVERISERL